MDNQFYIDKLQKHIEVLEERMRGADALIVLWETRATRAEARVEKLEAGLRDIDRACLVPEIQVKIRAALAQSSPPARQENDDVFKGFRGNNDSA